MVVIEAIGYVLLSFVVIALGAILVRQFASIRFEANREAAELEILRTRLEAARIARERASVSAAPWNGWRKFRVDKKVKESADTCSFYLVPHDRRPLPRFKPGQYLTFEFDGIPGENKPAIRCYSLSDCYDPSCYRISVKRVGPPRDKLGAPPGVGSCYLHDHVDEGSLLNVKAPNGHFAIDEDEGTPLVLIGGGIGVTPVLSMFNATIASGSAREVWFFYGVRNLNENILRDTLEKLSGQSAEHPNIHFFVCYSQDLGEDAANLKPYELNGARVGVDLLKERLPSNNYQFFTCGPPPMMAAIKEGLRAWGVPAGSINEEVFPGPKGAGASIGFGSAIGSVKFRKAGREVKVASDCSSLLDLAEFNGVEIPFACKVGSCGTCVTAVLSGEVVYLQAPSWKGEAELKEEGLCLPCICLPKAKLVIDR